MAEREKRKLNVLGRFLVEGKNGAKRLNGLNRLNHLNGNCLDNRDLGCHNGVVKV
jgi:hypothetical protein